MAEKELLKDMYRNYAASLGLKFDARYISGAPLRPVVPVDIALDGIFFIDGYPSCRLATFGKERNVPFADITGALAPERWFDGSKVRDQFQARVFEKRFLEPLGLRKKDCWVSTLVKVFLFRKQHMEAYKRLGWQVPEGYSRSDYFDLGYKSLPWIAREIREAHPRLVITLGAEVAGVLHAVKTPKDQIALVKPAIKTLEIGDVEVPIIHCAHLGLLGRPPEKNNPWPERHKEQFLPMIQDFLSGEYSMSKQADDEEEEDESSISINEDS